MKFINEYPVHHLLVFLLPILFVSVPACAPGQENSPSGKNMSENGKRETNEKDSETPSAGKFNPSFQTGEREGLVEVAAIPPDTNIVPGETFQIGFYFKMQPDWHIYWKNSGEAGMPTAIRVNGPDGFRIGDIRWPFPEQFKTTGITSYGYEGETVLFVPVTAPDSLPESPFRFQARVDYLACREKCIPGTVETTVEIPAGGVPLSESLRSRLRRYRSTIPKPVQSLSGSSVRKEEGNIIISGRSEGRAEIKLFPVAVSGVEQKTPVVHSENRSFEVKIPYDLQPENHLGEKPMAVEGVMVLREGTSEEAYSFSVPVGEEK